MSSTKRAPHTAPETAARIRDAAISAFAAQGFTKTTIRAIASAAEVSPGLVIHHFGSKEALRAQCDDHVFEALTARKRENAHKVPLVMGELFGDPVMRTQAEYLLTSMMDPSEPGQRFFTHYVETVETFIDEGMEGYVLRKFADRRAQAATIAALALAPLILESKMRQLLGTDGVQGTMTRIAPYLFDLYQHGFIEQVPEQHEAPGPRATPGSQHDPPAPQVP